jgi:hypothetical protein
MKQCTCYALRAVDCTCKPAKYGELYTSPQPKQEQGEPVAWRNAAIRVGEDLCSVGPFGYYDMTAEQWLDWALSVVTVHLPPQPKQEQGEPVAMRYDFDGYGYKYIDSGSGSDWQTRVKDAEPVYGKPQPKQEQGEPDWKALVLNHNAECESRCDMDRCGYKPYFEYSKRRCPNCFVHEMIDVEYTTPQQRTWVGLTDEELLEIMRVNYARTIPLIAAVEAKLKEKNT